MNEETHGGGQTQIVQNCIHRLAQGDASARRDLIDCACDRLLKLTRTIKHGFHRVNRWEQTEDVFQRATMRLFESLEKVELQDARHFFRLAALQIRRELIDLARHYGGPQGMGANHATQMVKDDGSHRVHAAYDASDQGESPTEFVQWGEFHQLIETLPENQREVVELLFYHGLPQDEAAEIMGVSTRTVKRYWRDARIALHEKLGGDLPGM